MDLKQKICSKCGLPRDIKDFHRKPGVGRRNSVCKFCKSEYDSQYHAQPGFRSINAERRAKKVAERKRVVEEAKSKPCADCGNRFNPWQMDFDHRPGSDKFMEISAMIRYRSGITKILAEIEKCDVVCANCHRERSHSRQHEEVQ